jgi:hypothetical protein
MGVAVMCAHQRIDVIILIGRLQRTMNFAR